MCIFSNKDQRKGYKEYIANKCPMDNTPCLMYVFFIISLNLSLEILLLSPSYKFIKNGCNYIYNFFGNSFINIHVIRLF